MRNLFDSKISDSIVRLHRLLEKNGAGEESSQLMEHLSREVLIISYFLPQTELGLAEEDASEFILYLKPFVEKIILSFKGGDFLSYIRKTLKNRLTSFYRGKLRASRTEAVAEIEGGIEILSECERVYAQEDECQTDADKLNLLKAVFSESTVARRRFFIFLCSLCPYLSEPELYCISSELCIDFSQMRSIREYLIKVSGADRVMANMKRREETRNANFAMAMVNEINAEVKKNEGLDEAASEYKAKALKRKDMVRRSLMENRKTSLGVGNRILGDLLNMPGGTIANNICLSKRLLSWCMSPCSYTPEMLSELRISRKFACLTLKTDSLKPLEVFEPYSEFSFSKDFLEFCRGRSD